jgi:hypothetical protein
VSTAFGRILLPLFTFLVAVSSNAQIPQPEVAGYWSGSSRAELRRALAGNLVSYGYAAYLTTSGSLHREAYLDVDHLIHPDGAQSNALASESKHLLQPPEYSGNVTFDPYYACFRGRVEGLAYTSGARSSSAWGSSMLCVTAPTPKPICPGDPSCPPAGTTCTAETPPEECQVSPIVINLGGGSYRLSDPSDPVQFDIDVDGDSERMTWTARNAAMGFLAFDRNGNGRVDDGAELFGNHTPLGGGPAANGFEALRQYDDNADGQLDREDAAWTHLLLWVDENHNGRSESIELLRLAGTDITALELDYRRSGRKDPAGNEYRYRARLQRAQRTDSYYDIFFRLVE